jgi:hypothetical protein
VPALTDAVADRETTRPTFVDPALQAHLDEFGFAVAPLLDEDGLALVRALYAELGPAPDDPQVSINWSFHSASSDYKQELKARVLPALRERLDAVLDRHEVYLTTFITKWPGPDSGFAPHQDPTLVDERAFRGVTVWLPLEETGLVDGRDNGMLRIVPGSHRFSRALRLPDVDHFQFAEHEEAIVHRHGVGVPTRPGEALVFDNRVLHFSMPNETDRPRVVLSFGVRPREGACVHLRRSGPDTLDLFEIDDDFYIDVLPAEQHAWQPPTAPIAHLRRADRRFTAEEFEALCGGVRPLDIAHIPAGEASGGWRDPGAFCARCGGREGLEDQDRTGRNNAQLICPRCAAELAG